MKGFSTLILAAAALTATAAQPTFLSEPFAPQKDLQLKNVTLTYGNSSVKKAPAKAENDTPAPEVLVGKTYVTFYSDGEIPCNSYFTATGTNSDLTLSGMADGYDVKGSYDPATGKITIPTNVVIATHQTYGDITIYALNMAAGQYNKGAITGTWNGNGFTFDYGIYGVVSAGTLIFMGDMSAQESNATLSMQQSPTVFTVPLLVTKTDENTISVVGVSNLLFGAYAPLPFTLNETAGTATLTAGTVTDKQYKSGAYINWYLFGKDAIGYLDDLTTTVTTTETTSLLKASAAFLGYQAETGGYSGYNFTDFSINIDFNVYTGETAGDDDGDTDTPEINDIKYLLDRTNMTATVTGALETVTDLKIPAQIEVESGVYTVTAVGDEAFMANRNITTITLPATITTVGQDAFRNVSNLKNLYIEDLAAWCAIVFANGNANPIYNAFPTSQSKWGKIYINGEAVTELVIPEGVESIGRSFYGFKSLTSVSLPSTLTVIGDQAFGNCTGLTEMTIPANVTSVGSLFFGCSNLQKVTFEGNALEKIGGSAFYSCQALEEVNLPEGLKEIGTMSFASCKALKTLSFPSTLETIGMMAIGCPNLESLECKATVPPTAAMWAFDDVNKEIPVYVPESSMEAYATAAEWKDFTNFLPALTGVEGVEIENAPVEYYNLQGIRVAEPKAGNIYLRRQAGKTSKVIL